VYNVTIVAQQLQTPGLTEYQQFALAYQIAAPYNWFFFGFIMFLLLVLGLTLRVTRRNGTRTIALFQSNYLIIFFLVLALGVTLTLLAHFLPLIPYVLVRWFT
jgi:hypothetical protein